MRRTIFFSVLIMMVAAACGGDAPAEAIDLDAQSANNTDNTTTTSTDTTDSPSLNTDGLVASVNGKGITQGEFDRAFVRIAGNTTASDNNALAIQVLNALIEQEVIAQASETMDITVSDADVEAEISSLQQGLADTSWNDWLASNQYTEDELRSALRNSIITNRVRDNVIAQLGESVEQVHARHILVATEDEAQSILDRLAGGEDFASLATQHSLDVTTRDFGGDLGWFMREELLDVTLADKAFEIGEGEIAGPVITRLGYHILQTIEKGERTVEAERMPFLVENIFNRWLEEQLLTADVERY